MGPREPLATEPARLRHRLESSPLAERLLWILDQQQEGVLISGAGGTIVDVNRAAARMLGADQAVGLIGTGAENPVWSELRDVHGDPIPPDRLPAVLARRTGRPVHTEVRFRGRWYRVEAQYAGPGQDDLVVTVFVDVTAEIAAREEAAAARRHVERIAQAVDRALFTAEVLPGGRLRLDYVCPSFESLADATAPGGISLEVATARVHPEEHGRLRREIAALREGEPLDVIHRLVEPEGRVRFVRAQAIPWLSDDGRRFVDGALTDLTADRAAQERLAASEALQRASAREQAALHQVAAAIAGGAPPETVFGLLAGELGRLLDVPGAFIAEFTGNGEIVLRGLWPESLPGRYDVGTVLALGNDTLGRRIERTGTPARATGAPGDPMPQRLGVPVVLGEKIWGYLGVVADADVELGPEAMARLELFSRVAGTAVASAAARERLVAQASTDPLTLLANHRVFQERLREEVRRAHRHDRPLALVVLDLDHFKEINDSFGHQAGDDVLRLVAGTISGVARSSDTVARLGGDEFALLAPETDAAGALALAERMREALAHQDAVTGSLTISAGVAALDADAEADELLRMADAALYRAKAAGRDGVRVGGEATGPDEASVVPQPEQLARAQALRAVRVLARANDAKDPSTRGHSERVAELASDLARLLGWPDDRVALLHEAALLHDVGKIVVPDAVLLKPGALEPREREHVERHAEAGAAIAAGVLSPEQVEWIRHHHERPDGRGYPDGITGPELSEGALLLGLADAWDAMTTVRQYKDPKPPDVALDECRRLAGAQFAQHAVEALSRRSAAGVVTR